MRKGVIIQAQLGIDSNKKDDFLFDEIEGMTVLERTVKQVLKTSIDNVYILSSQANSECAELPIIKSNNIKVYIKRENSFVKAYQEIVRKEELDIIVRVIGSNPLLLPNLIEISLREHLSNNADYSYYRGFPIGIVPSEIISSSALFNSKTIDKENLKVRNITTSIRNNRNLNIHEFKADREYFEYNSVNLSYSNSKKEKISSIIKNGIEFKTISKYFNNIPNNVRNVEITNLCNLECIMCARCGKLSNYSVFSGSKGSMAFEDFKKIIDQFPGLDSIGLSGGEPLLNKDIKEIIRYCNSKDIKVRMTSNGLLLTEEFREFLIKNLSSIEISIDGTNKSTYEEIRVNGNYNTLISNLECFMEDIKNIKRNKINNIKLYYVCMENNYTEMSKLIKLASELKIKSVSFLPYIEFGNIKKCNLSNRLKIKNNEIFNKHYKKAEKLAKEYDIKISLDHHTRPRYDGWKNCEWQDSFWITWKGYVTPCCGLDKAQLFNFGNLIDKDISELYNTAKWKNFRWKLFNDQAPDVCNKYCFR